MHYASARFLSRYVEWKNVEKNQEPVTNQRITDIYRPFGTDKSVPYAKDNIFLIQ